MWNGRRHGTGLHVPISQRCPRKHIGEHRWRLMSLILIRARIEQRAKRTMTRIPSAAQGICRPDHTSLHAFMLKEVLAERDMMRRGSPGL